MTVRSAKSKGSAFEMDVEESLQQKFPDLYRTKERGYIKQYDHVSKESEFVVECKRLKGISWNQLVKFHEKLMKVAPPNYTGYLIFKSNFQPCLVFEGSRIETFEEVFGVDFIKHKSTREQ